MNFWYFALQGVWFILPAGIANMVPVLFSRTLKFLDYPVDGGRTFRGERLFGDHKTWRGMLLAPIFGLLTFLLQRQLSHIGFFSALSLFNYEVMSVWIGVLLGLGAIIGDLVKSFFKRRAKIAPGHSWFPFDQIDWIVGAFVFSAPLFFPGLRMIIVTFFAGIVLHILTNLAGYVLRIKKNLL